MSCRIAGIVAFLLALPAPLHAAESKFFDSAGARLHFTDEGSGDAVVLIHGYAGSLSWWRDLGITRALVEAGYRVVAYDNRGHGRSGRPHSRDKYGIEMVADAKRLLDHLGIRKAHFVGYSMGAVIANKFREQHADRVRSVTLAGYGQPPLPKSYSEELVRQIEVNLRAMELSVGNDPVALAHVSLGWSQWTVNPDDLKRNPHPTLALIGREDPFLSDTRGLAARMAKLTVRVLPGDHGTLPTHPAFVDELVAHLRNGQPRRPAAGDH